MKVSRDEYAENFGKKYAASLPSLGEALVEILQFFGCERMYGVGGDYAANLIGAFEEKINVCPSSNEMHAGFTACGQAEIENLGVCLTTYTVGSLPCVSAAALAITEKLPVIFISGAPGESEVTSMALHHTVSSCSTWQTEYDAALNAFKALGMRAERLYGARNSSQPNVAAEHFFQLVSYAYLSKQPVFIEVPRDLINQKTQALRLPVSINHLAQETFILKGAKHVAQQILDKLNNAQRPLLFLGEKAKLNSQLLSYTKNFCEKFNIPYVTSWLAKGILDEFSTLSLGAYNGVFSDENVREYIENEVDYVLEVATSINQLDTNTAFATGTHLLSTFKNKTVLKGTAQLEKDIITTFEYLIESDVPSFNFIPLKEKSFDLEQNEHIDFHNLTLVLNQLQSHDKAPYIYFPEIGNSYFASYSLKTRMSSVARSWITNPWYAAMGTSLPYARATCKKLISSGAKDLPIVITGDGGFNFQLNELIHFLRDELNIIIIYMRNNIFHLGKNSDAEIYHCSDEKLDVIGLVKAFGGSGKRCNTVGEFIDYFKQCSTNNKGIRLIEIPAITDEKYQCREIRLLNLYIKAQNGEPKALSQWNNLKTLPNSKTSI